MTNEARLLFETGPAIPFTVSNTAGIEKGALLKMTDFQTAVINSSDSDVVAGIAASEKINGDGKVRLGVYREGIFRVLVSGTVTTGDALKISSVTNAVATAVVDDENIIGIALEDATDTHTIRMELKPFHVNLG